MKVMSAWFALAWSPMVALGQPAGMPLPILRAVAFDATAVQQDDERREQAGELPLYGRKLALAVSSADGTWSVDGSERVCRLAVSSPGALAMELFLEDVSVPAGARMRITTLDGQELHPYVGMDLPQDVHEYATPLVSGDSWVLEYREPVDALQPGRFSLPWLSHAYRDVEAFTDREGNCHVNVACSPERDGWEGPIKATVRISVVVPQGTGWCTGTLVNNVRQDCAPYILSAFHCGRESTTANFNQYKFYFNFQYAGCSGGSYSTAQFMTGAQLKAYSNDYNPQYQGLGGSDFMLLHTNAGIPGSFEPYWAGWDATNLSTVTADGVCIHHPTGAPKRISSYTQTLTTGHPMASSGLMSHYKLIWAATEHGWGITEVGSSGSGLFKHMDGTGPVLIGTCTGNSSGMTCSNHSGWAYFGKMSYHWTNNPNTANLKLKAWLDPDNTGTTVLGGSDSPCSSPAGTAEQLRQGQLSAYPNPASGLVTIGQVVGADARFTVFNATGHAVLTGRISDKRPTIDVAGLPNGAYLVRLESDLPAPESIRLLVMH